MGQALDSGPIDYTAGALLLQPQTGEFEVVGTASNFTTMINVQKSLGVATIDSS